MMMMMGCIIGDWYYTCGTREEGFFYFNRTHATIQFKLVIQSACFEK